MFDSLPLEINCHWISWLPSDTYPSLAQVNHSGYASVYAVLRKRANFQRELALAELYLLNEILKLADGTLTGMARREKLTRQLLRSELTLEEVVLLLPSLAPSEQEEEGTVSNRGIGETYFRTRVAQDVQLKLLTTLTSSWSFSITAFTPVNEEQLKAVGELAPRAPPPLAIFGMLNSLFLRGLGLKELPVNLAKLVTLQQLDIRDNHLERLPGFIWKIASVLADGNPLQVIEEDGQSTQEHLSLSNCGLTSLALFADLTLAKGLHTIKTLDLSFNQLTKIEQHPSIEVKTLLLSHNQINLCIYPTTLARLDLSNNQIRHFTHIEHIGTCDLSHNPLRSFQIRSVQHLDISFTHMKKITLPARWFNLTQATNLVVVLDKSQSLVGETNGAKVLRLVE